MERITNNFKLNLESHPLKVVTILERGNIHYCYKKSGRVDVASTSLAGRALLGLWHYPRDRVTNINFNSDFNEDSNIRKAKVVFITTSHLFMSPRICVSCYFPSKRDVLSINVFSKDLGWWGMFQCSCGTQAVETLSSSTFTHPWYLTYYRPRRDDNTRSWWSSSQSRE